MDDLFKKVNIFTDVRNNIAVIKKAFTLEQYAYPDARLSFCIDPAIETYDAERLKWGYEYKIRQYLMSYRALCEEINEILSCKKNESARSEYRYLCEMGTHLIALRKSAMELIEQCYSCKDEHIKENRRLKVMAEAVDSIIEKYRTITSIEDFDNYTPSNQLEHRERIELSKEYIRECSTIQEKIVFIRSQIECILLCEGCKSIDERYSWLTSNIIVLDDFGDQFRSLQKILVEKFHSIQDKEKLLIDVTIRVGEIKTKYGELPALPSEVSMRDCEHLSISAEFLNTDVIATVQHYKQTKQLLIIQIKELHKQILDVLRCPGCDGIVSEYMYLSTKLTDLEKYKAVEDDLLRKIREGKISIRTEMAETMSCLSNAFESLFDFHAVDMVDMRLGDFLPKQVPVELVLFDFKISPVTISFGSFYYCLFSTVILVFDYNGCFTTALDPTALEIRVGSRVISSVRRYSSDKETIFFGIAHEFCSFDVKSIDVINAFDLAAKKYLCQHNHLCSMIPSLLDLLQCVSERATDIKGMKSIYDERLCRENLFCRICGN